MKEMRNLKQIICIKMIRKNKNSYVRKSKAKCGHGSN